MQRWDRISEGRMRRAEAKGDLKGLAGEGRPLPDRPENALIDSGTAVGHRIMAEADAVPLELRKRLLELQAAYSAKTDPAARKAIMAVLSEVQMRHAMEAEARRKFLGR